MLSNSGRVRLWFWQKLQVRTERHWRRVLWRSCPVWGQRLTILVFWIYCGKVLIIINYLIGECPRIVILVIEVVATGRISQSKGFIKINFSKT